MDHLDARHYIKRLPSGRTPIDTSTRLGWLTHLHAWCRNRGEQHVMLIGDLCDDGTVTVAPGLCGHAVQQSSKMARALWPDRIAAVHVDVLKHWLERQAA